MVDDPRRLALVPLFPDRAQRRTEQSEDGQEGRRQHAELGLLPRYLEDQVDERPSRQRLRAGQVPHPAEGLVMRAEGHQATSEVAQIGEGMGLVRIPEHLRRLAGKGGHEESLAGG